MPPRWAVLGIVFFWLAVTCWQVQRDMWPSLFPPPDQPPLFDIDLTDELGTNHTNWQVFVNGEDAGGGSSEVKDLGDGSLRFKTKLLFQKKPLFDFCKSIETTNRITNKGRLLNVSLLCKVQLPGFARDPEIGLDAKIEEEHLHAQLTSPLGSMDLPTIQVPENGIVFNPTHLGTRIRLLRKGQTWRVPLLDLSTMLERANFFDLGAANKLTEGVVGKELWAAVDQEVIKSTPTVAKDGKMNGWSGDDVLCHKIEFTQPGKGVVATTWVRSRDGQVLKQQAKLDVGLLKVDLLLVRVHSGL